MSKHQRGRPMASDKIQVTPEFREDPDVKKLAQTLISIAINIAEQKQAKIKPDAESKKPVHTSVSIEQEDDMD